MVPSVRHNKFQNRIVFLSKKKLLTFLAICQSGDALVDVRQSTLNIFRRFLIAFSWRRNYEILFSSVPKYCINDVIEIVGLRALCLLWILLVHVCTVLYYISGKSKIVVYKELRNLILKFYYFVFRLQTINRTRIEWTTSISCRAF